MITINARNYGVAPDKEISCELARLFSYIATLEGEKLLTFDKGTYYIDSLKCEKKLLYITNTAGDEEFEKDETPHMNKVAFYLEGISDLVVEGNSAVFIIDGKATNMAVIDSRNILIRNLEIRHAHPDMHELKVVNKSRFYVDYELDRDSLYEFEKGKMYFFGRDYRVSADKGARSARWIGLIREETPDTVRRVSHPLKSALKIKQVGKSRIRVLYPCTRGFRQGDRFYIYDVRRQYAGIFADTSVNITFENIRQRFNYSLALVAQRCENITVDSVDFSPENDGARRLASVADFIQLCMCRGNVTVKNSNFVGAGDDCLNVHGVHFIIREIKENSVAVRFMHPQTHGFNPVRRGDEIAFVNTASLLEKGRAVVLESALINEKELMLTLDSVQGAAVGDAVEDVTACPDMDFIGNTVSRIITRGLLITTRGKVNVQDNRFISTSMSGILISDDAESWFESGRCLDVSIKGNVFDYCGETPILIKPENKKHLGAVHKNIRITGNTFRKYEGVCIYAKSTDGLVIEGNSFSEGEHLKTENCSSVDGRL